MQDVFGWIAVAAILVGCLAVLVAFVVLLVDMWRGGSRQGVIALAGIALVLLGSLIGSVAMEMERQGKAALPASEKRRDAR